MHPFAVGTDPGGAVADAPFVLLEAVRADLKAAAAVPAEGFLLFAAVAAELLLPPSTPDRFACLSLVHGASPTTGRSSCPSQAR